MSKNKSEGFAMGVVLFVIFISLKLTNIIDWSWWWVTAPLWLPVVIVIGIGITAIIILLSKMK